MKMRAMVALVFLAAGAVLGGCNTVSGVGQDIQDASSATKKAITGGDSSPKTDSNNK